jgi:hypothetical protein
MLPASVDAAKTIGPALKRLCSMKRLVDLTPHQTETWLAVLSVFEPSVVNEAVLKLGLSEDPFPDIGKLATLCNTLRRQRAGIVGDQQGIGTKLVQEIAEALAMKLR